MDNLFALILIRVFTFAPTEQQQQTTRLVNWLANNV